MGSASSIETRASIRASRKETLIKSVQSYRDQTNKSSASASAALNRDESNRSYTTNFKANDRISFAVALQEYNYEGSNRTARTESSDSAVVCIMRSDKLSFSGTGHRRHAKRKRMRQKGKDTTRIIVLRQPTRLDSTMMKVDERIPKKEIKKPLKKITAGKKIAPVNCSPYPALLPEKTMRPPRASRKSTKMDTFKYDDTCCRDNVISMSYSSRDFLSSSEFLTCQ